MSISRETQPYKKQEAGWPKNGRHILAHYDDKNIVVYQILNDKEVKHWMKEGNINKDNYICGRTARICVNFFLLMFMFKWTRESGKERVIAITIVRKGFDEILSNVQEPVEKEDEVHSCQVQLRWVPDRLPDGEPVFSQRLVMQLLLMDKMVCKFKCLIQKIEDITDYVKQQEYCRLLQDDDLDKFLVPIERIYIPSIPSTCETIKLEGFTKKDSDKNRKVTDPKTGNNNIMKGFCLADFFTSQRNPEESEDYSSTGQVNIKALFEQRILNLKSLEPRDMILCIIGAFSPIHTRHIEVLEQSKKWIEENTNFRITSGYLAVASDAYVKKKCANKHQKGISFGHRVKLAEIATDDIGWLHVYKDAVPSAIECGNNILKANKLSADIAEVCGADRVTNKSKRFFWSDRYTHYTLCIGRKGETERVKRAFASDFKHGRAFNDHFVFIPKEMENVSSTQIRSMMSQVFDAVDEQSKSEAMNNIIERGWITENVAKYILNNLQDLFIK